MRLRASDVCVFEVYLPEEHQTIPRASRSIDSGLIIVVECTLYGLKHQVLVSSSQALRMELVGPRLPATFR